MKATDVMLVFLMLMVWGQNYQVSKDFDNMRQRAPRTGGCVRALPARGL